MLAVVDDAQVRAGEGHAAWSESFNEMFAQVAGVFANAAVRRHGRAYLLGLLSHQERKNSWSLAEFAGDVSPDGMQRLLSFSPWDEDACRDAVRRYVVRNLGDPAAVLAVDETGFLKKGKMSAGVTRQYTGTAGRIENAQVGVFLAYAGPDGSRALIDRELYLPEKWTGDRERCRAAGIGDGVAFATKPELARQMIERAMMAGVPFAWVAGDEVYGGNPKLRQWLEEQEVPYVMAVACSEMIATAAGARRGRAGRAGPLGGVAAAELRRRIQGAKAVRLGVHRHRVQRPSPAGPPVPGPGRERRARAGVLPLLVAPPGHAARGRRGGRGAVGGRGLLRRSKERDRPGPLPGPQVPCLVPARHPVHARARVPRRRRPRRPAAATATAVGQRERRRRAC